MKYGLSTLMLVVFVASVICGIAARGSFAAFVIGFMAAAVLLVQLMAKSGPRPVVVHEAATDADAHMLRNFLVDHGIDARVDASSVASVYPSLGQPRVVVPPAQLDRTREVLQEFEARNRAQDDVAADVAMNKQGTVDNK